MGDPVELVADRRVDPRVAVAVDVAPQRGDAVDVAAAVGVDQVGALGRARSPAAPPRPSRCWVNGCQRWRWSSSAIGSRIGRPTIESRRGGKQRDRSSQSGSAFGGPDSIRERHAGRCTEHSRVSLRIAGREDACRGDAADRCVIATGGITSTPSSESFGDRRGAGCSSDPLSEHLARPCSTTVPLSASASSAVASGLCTTPPTLSSRGVYVDERALRLGVAACAGLHAGARAGARAGLPARGARRHGTNRGRRRFRTSGSASTRGAEPRGRAAARLTTLWLELNHSARRARRVRHGTPNGHPGSQSPRCAVARCRYGYTHLRAVPAHGHRAPRARAIPRMVVERPLAVVGGACLQPRPRPVHRRLEDDRREASDRRIERPSRAVRARSRPRHGGARPAPPTRCSQAHDLPHLCREAGRRCSRAAARAAPREAPPRAADRRRSASSAAAYELASASHFAQLRRRRPARRHRSRGRAS